MVDSFVLRGSKPTFSTRLGYLTNSQITNTTLSLDSGLGNYQNDKLLNHDSKEYINTKHRYDKLPKFTSTYQISKEAELVSEKLNRSLMRDDIMKRGRSEETKQLSAELRFLSKELEKMIKQPKNDNESVLSDTTIEGLLQSMTDKLFAEVSREMERILALDKETLKPKASISPRKPKKHEPGERIKGEYYSLPLENNSNQWFLDPVHLRNPEFNDYLENGVYQKHFNLPTRYYARIDRDTGDIGATVAAKQIENNVLKSPKLKKDVKNLANMHFPTTFLTRSIEEEQPYSETIMPRPLEVVAPDTEWNMHGTLRRAKSAKYYNKKVRNALIDKLPVNKSYLMFDETPAMAEANVHLTSPFSTELGKLRMAKLRIEEERLLEIKRQEELERLRGPMPRWYESKGRNFHYEAHKNTEEIKNRDSWQELMDYKHDLLRASQEFESSYS